MHGGSNLNKKCVIKYKLKTLFGVVLVQKKSHLFYCKSQRLSFIALDSKRDAKVITTQSEDSILI